MLLQSCFSGMGRVTPRSIIRITFFYVLSMMQDFVPGRVFHHSSSQQLLIESTFSPTMRNRCAFVSRVVSSYRTNAVQGTLPACRGVGKTMENPAATDLQQLPDCCNRDSPAKNHSSFSGAADPSPRICWKTNLNSFSCCCMYFFPASVGEYNFDLPETFISRYPFCRSS
jgi:hypothetical protein